MESASAAESAWRRQLRFVDSACDRFEASWQHGERPALEAFLAEADEPIRGELFKELLSLDLAYRRDAGESPTAEEYLKRFPDWPEMVRAAFHPPDLTTPETYTVAHATKPRESSGGYRILLAITFVSLVVSAGIWLVFRRPTENSLPPTKAIVTAAPDLGPHSEPLARVAPVLVPPEPLPEFVEGQPLGEKALVTRPTKVDYVLSWTIETTGHRGEVTGLGQKPDGTQFATASRDATLRIWDASDGKLLRVFVGTHSFVSCAWSPDGAMIAACNTRGELQLWNSSSGRRVRTLKLDEPAVRLAWSRQGRQIACSQRLSAECWDVVTGKRLQHVATGAEPSFIAWSPSGDQIAVAVGKQVSVKSMRDTEEAINIDQQSSVLALAWWNETILFASDAERNVQAWRMDQKNPRSTKLLGSDGESVAMLFEDHQAALRRADANEAKVTIAPMSNLTISPEGQVSEADAELHHLVYVVQTPTGQLTLAPAEFRKRFRKQ